MNRCFIFFAFGMGCLVNGAEDSPDFAREVLPILSEKCFVCHGPDAKKKELRLDSSAGATADLGGYQAINPNAPDKSELIARIHDKEDPMPPRKSESTLSDAEKNILTRWVKSGGNYTKHWAFATPRKSQSDATIDSHVEANLKSKGHSFSGKANRATLARRVALILTGLPPEPAQLEPYLEDSSDQAYEKLIDKLLASPRFGEHAARYWLDAVRYGDTHGLHLDNRRGIFPYRDWVVKAFNENLPFDEFITWQLAGDLLPSPSLEQQVATGYVRMNPTTSEGGAIPAEFQAKNNFDRTENLGTVFLGMTLNCARCHTHKYDPIQHQEYYEMLAFFNSTAEGPMDGNAYLYAPVLEVPASQEAWEKWNVLEKEREGLLGRIEQFFDKDPNLESGLAKFATGTLDWKTSDWVVSKTVPLDAPKPDSWKAIKGPADLRKERFGKLDQAMWVRFDIHFTKPQRIFYKTNAGPKSHFTVSGHDSPGNLRHAAISGEKGVQTVFARLQGIDGKAKASIELHNPWEELARVKKWDAIDPLDKILMVGDSHCELFPENLRKESLLLSSRLIEAQGNFTTTLVAKDLPHPRQTRLLERGEYNMPVGDPLEPGVFAVMNPFPDKAPKNRLGLARWLTSPDHPLVSRVLVNRIWQSVFGAGLVRTPEDFGLQGKQPTHPELLDHLSVDFIETGWDYKSLIKKMVMSRTFCQDSAWRKDLADPDNLLLARGPSFRLDAEVIRDTGLWASGLLHQKMGGEGVKPWQPEGMWAALAHPGSNTKNYVPDLDDRINQRSLYVYWKRTSPHPMMTLFDAPNRESSCVRRSRGNTPLQSLGLLNEPQRVNMARSLAQRLVESAPDDEARLQSLFTALACRPPLPSETKACVTLLNQARDRYRENPDDAASLLNNKNSESSVIDLAAWTQLSGAVLASDIAILLY